MTKQEAINLESECEKLLSDALGYKCTISMALTGNLKAEFDGSYIAISKRDLYTPDFINFRGFYDELIVVVEKIQKVFSENKDKFKLLLESYHINFED